MYPSAISIFLAKNGFRRFRQIMEMVSKKTDRPKAIVGLDMIVSNFLFGSTFPEYYNLLFYRRTYKNRSTYLTTFANKRFYSRLNDRRQNGVFHDKSVFNTVFSDYIGRAWADFRESPERVMAFLREHEKVMVKPRLGDSGKGIFIISSDEIFSIGLDEFARTHQDCIAEEILVNHDTIAEINTSSLSTIRFITLRASDKVHFVFAGLRIGAPGKIVDNVSEGGRVAVIDCGTGLVVSNLRSKMTSSEGVQYEDSGILEGFRVPMWQETIDFVSSLTQVVPNMRYLAWDVAITNKGPVVIEGNHSSGNTIIQSHLSVHEEGLKPLVDAILGTIKR